jgi:hypothetical protein
MSWIALRTTGSEMSAKFMDENRGRTFDLLRVSGTCVVCIDLLGCSGLVERHEAM